MGVRSLFNLGMQNITVFDIPMVFGSVSFSYSGCKQKWWIRVVKIAEPTTVLNIYGIKRSEKVQENNFHIMKLLASKIYRLSHSREMKSLHKYLDAITLYFHELFRGKMSCFELIAILQNYASSVKIVVKTNNYFWKNMSSKLDFVVVYSMQ